MGIDFTQKNMHKLVLPRIVVLLFEVHGYDMSNNEYYGELRSILELPYIGRNFVYRFDCDLWDIGSLGGVKKEQGFTIVNTSHKWYESKPFILACQVTQVFYLKLGDSWKVAQTLTNRNMYYILTIVDGDN